MSAWQQFVEVVVPLGAAVALGGMVGLDRELRGRFAGLRTHMLVALGSAVFTLAGLAIASTTNAGADLTRVIQGIAAGVGFIGAGTVLKLTDHAEVRGLTTASSIWLAAAIGTAAGTKLYVLACGAAVLGVLVLAGIGRVEGYLENKAAAGKAEPKSSTTGERQS